MERRVLLAVILSFVVLYAYQALYPSTPTPNDAQKTAQTSKGATAAKPATSAPASTPQAASAASQTAAAAPSTAPAPQPTQPEAPARDLAIDTPYVHGVFTTRGGALKTWQLKKFTDNEGHPVDVVAEYAPAPLPFTVSVDDPAISARLASAPFTVTEEPQAGGAARVWRATFDYADPSGLRVRKTFVNDQSKPYVIDVTVSATRNGQPVPATIDWGPALGTGIVPKSRTYNPPPEALFYKDAKVSRVTQAKISAQATQEGTFGFVGADDHYFLTALVAPPAPLKVDYKVVDVLLPNVPAVEGPHYVQWSVRFTSPVAQPLTYFVGPKDFDILASVDRDLVRSIDFGVFSWLVVPLLRALKWINGYVGNFGWSVIILTILINVVMFPIRHKSVVSMRRMQEVQPEAKAIQDRYKHLKMSDPARAKMNEELMALYKVRGVNPAGGCVPMLLTLPVLYAFYAMLEVAIELRGAPWIWWIHDLSAKDPYYILPVLMGVTMFIQQKMTPTTPDPTQQKMMMFMPVMLTAMFLWFASGLVLYYAVNNLWGILQQAITFKLIGPPQVKTVRPPAERRVKRVGEGSTNGALKERK